MTRGPRKLRLIFGSTSLSSAAQVTCLPEELQNATLQTLRHRILLMPAQLRRTDNKPRLVLPASGPREKAWKHALQQINKLKL
jgi:hypothetical protein